MAQPRPFYRSLYFQVLVAIALGASAFSLYIVYLLEIVKLANPRVRRRRAEEDSERLTA